MIFSRRELVRLFGRGAAGWAVAGAYGCGSGSSTSPTPSAFAQGVVEVRLHSTMADPIRRQSVAAVGRAYLESHGGSRDQLRLEIATALDRNDTTPAPPEALFRRAVHRDFADGAVVDVEGWLLSGTEARFGALVALAAPQ